MTPHQRSLSYLENAITVAAFGSEEGRDAFLSTHVGEDLVEIAMRHIDAHQRSEYVKAAQPLSTCGVPEIEQRARQIIAFASPPAAHGGEEFSEADWRDLTGE